MMPRRLLTLVAAWLAGAMFSGCATVDEPVEVSAPALATEQQGPARAASPVDSVAPAAVPVRPAPAAPPSRPVAARTHMAIDPLSPAVPVDLDALGAREDLWVRIRAGYAVPAVDGDLVRKWEQWYAARPDYVQRMTDRGGRYLFHIVEELARRGMPLDLALLPFVESAFNPQANSVAQAAGMWQFVAATGRDWSLRQNVFRDDRRGVLRSTQAALNYLQSLHDQFDDWQLALAAYNWGQGNVQRAIARNLRAGLPTGYDSLRMPDETRNYLPKLQAVKNIVARPGDYGLALPPLANHPYFVSVPIERDIDVDLAARLAGLPIEEFRQLNPQMIKPVIFAAGTPQVLLPYDSANIFVRAVNNHAGPLATWTAWTAPKTLKPAEAARAVGTDEQSLREVNAIPKGMVVKAGSTLLVPRDPQTTSEVAAAVADEATLALAPDAPLAKRVRFKVGRRGDSVAAVARRYRVTEAQVAQWNQVAVGARFKPGQMVVVMKPQPHAAAKPAARAAKGGTRRVARPNPPARARAAPVREPPQAAAAPRPDPDGG